MAGSKSAIVELIRRFTHSVLEFIETSQKYFYAISKIVYLELDEGRGYNIFLRIRALFSGYTTDLYYYFKKYFEGGTRYCISEFDVHYRLRYINGPYGVVIVDKHIMYSFFNGYNNFLPKLYFHINNGRFKQDGSGGKSQEELIGLLKKEKKLIRKETDVLKHGGFKVCLLEYDSDNGAFLFNKKKISEQELITKLKSEGDYIVTEYVKQAGYASEIFQDSTNTIRIITLYDMDTDECWIACATHRFGTRRSRFVDNVSMGGISVGIDIDTGALGQGILWDNNYKKSLINIHPDTGVSFENIKVNNWPFVKKKILEMAYYAFKTPFIGWDIAVTEDSFKIIEVNDRPDIQLNQVYYPLLKDERNRKFFARYNVKLK